MKVKMASAPEAMKKTSRLPASFVLAATIIMVIIAVSGLLAITLSTVAVDTSLLSQSSLALGIVSSSSISKGISDPDQYSVGDPDQIVLRR